jgi:flagellar biosynthesis/type III secretory pathway protein FliH
MGHFALESFEDLEMAEHQANPAYEDGFAAGHAAGLQEAAEQQIALQTQVVQAIADYSFTYSEAKAEVTQSLAPLFSDIIDKILPHCVAAGFGVELSAMLQSALQSQLDGGLTLCVHPSQVDPVTSTLSDTVSAPAVIADPALSPHAACLRIGKATSYLDLDRLCDEISTVLSAVHFTSERMEPHG